jgi:hypothetical protein
MHYTAEEQARLDAEQHADMRRAEAECLDMLTELSVLVDWLTPRNLDQSRQHRRAHEIIELLSKGLRHGVLS